MYLLYIIALLFAVLGGVLWIKYHKINIWEWLIVTVVAFTISGIFHACVLQGMTGDVETWSGRVTSATFHPKWVEEYEEAVYRTEYYTDSQGISQSRRVFSHYETRYRTHSEYWDMKLSFGTLSQTKNIDKSRYVGIKKSFGGKIQITQPHKGGFYSGDRNIYAAYNATGIILPVTMKRSWTNRIKAAPSVFSYIEVPEDASVYAYPENRNFEISDRLIGLADRDIGIYAWDCMNARLGPAKKVNVIMVGFGSGDSGMADLQEAKWIGGKKNDLVLCYGNDWARVFGWTESELVKRNLETILLEGPIDNYILIKVEKEIRANYEIKDWSKFDYITLEPPGWSYFVLFGVMMLIQGIILYISFRNDWEKGN